jgi:anti-sigma B factor antagonist
MMIDVSPLEDDAMLVRPNGRLDAAAAPGFLSRMTGLVAEGKTRLVVDLAQVSFVDSSGLGALVSGLKAARRAEGDLRLVAPGQQIRKLLKLTTLDRVFVISDTLEQLSS